MRAGSLEAESFRKKFGDVRLPGAVCPLKENGGVRAEFVNYLPASSAGRTRDSVVVGDGDGANLDLGAQRGYRRENRGTFGAVGHAVRSVLDIAAGENLAVGEQDRRADAEVGIRG